MAVPATEKRSGGRAKRLAKNKPQPCVATRSQAHKMTTPSRHRLDGVVTSSQPLSDTATAPLSQCHTQRVVPQRVGFSIYSTPFSRRHSPSFHSSQTAPNSLSAPINSGSAPAFTLSEHPLRQASEKGRKSFNICLLAHQKIGCAFFSPLFCTLKTSVCKTLIITHFLFAEPSVCF